MKYKVTISGEENYKDLGEFEATTGLDAIRQAQQSFAPGWEKPGWFATPLYEAEKVFYKNRDGKQKE